jgi:predicted DNA-binding transcriptional regulator YafY
VSRNAEVIRQWTVLREIETARAGVTIDELSSRCGVTTRTIRRDLQALQEAGFPLFDDRSADDGRTRWQINGQALKGLATGLTLSELCALYFSRSLLESLSGTPFREDLEHAFDKMGASLTPHMRKFLDQLPRMLATKADPMRRADHPHAGRIVARLLEAILHHRQAMLVYDSASSRRMKRYKVHPHRLALASGALYMLAWVPEYRMIRTFAVHRIQEVSLLEERFTPLDDLPDTAFPDSLGVHSGPPVPVEIVFRREAADYVRGFTWHPSQVVRDLEDGGLALSLRVCVDRALRSWILGFGSLARVVSPPALAQDVADQLDEARAQYR